MSDDRLIQLEKIFALAEGMTSTEDLDAMLKAFYADAATEALQSSLAAANERIGRYKEREEHFAKVLQVSDGGQYRADWDSAIRRVVEERDAANERIAKLEGALNEMLSPSMDWSNGEVGVGHRFRNLAREALTPKE